MTIEEAIEARHSVRAYKEQPLVVEKLPLQNFYTAEEYHQDYLDKNPDGYCHLPLSLFEFAKKAKEKKETTSI
jgi:peptide methionine sulfoxide reductase msrA/msrB